MGKKQKKGQSRKKGSGISMTDPGTRELGLRHTLKVERYSAGVRVRNLTGSPLEALLYAGLLTDQIFGTMDDFLADMYRCGHLGLRSSDYNKVRVDGASQSDEMPLVYTRTQERLSRIQKLLGPGHINALYMLLNHDPSITTCERTKADVARMVGDMTVVLDQGGP